VTRTVPSNRSNHRIAFAIDASFPTWAHDLVSDNGNELVDVGANSPPRLHDVDLVPRPKTTWPLSLDAA
jgi:hypothetical protein